MKKTYNVNIEALRGFCALIVVMHHAVLYNTSLGNQYNLPLYYGFPGHTMVLIFFILSGYVIGINYYDKPSFSIRSYILKRFLRLYPIYLFAVLFTFILFSESKRVVLGNLFFLQNIAVSNLIHDNALWSLNHEVVYYIIAIPILAYRINLSYIVPVILSILLISVFFYPFPTIVEGYLVGSLFWLTGFQLSIYTIKGVFNAPVISSNKFLSVLFLLLASGGLHILPSFFRQLPTLHQRSRFPYDDLVSFSDFSGYILCLYAILFVIDRKWSKPLGALAYISVWSAVLERIITGNVLNNRFFYVPFFFLCVSLFLLIYPKQINSPLKVLRYLGELSYGIYVIHLPILYVIGNVKTVNTSLLSYGVRIAVFLVVVIGVAYFLEKLLQVKVKAFLSQLVPSINSGEIKQTSMIK